jgi:formylglycine-generating enzyme required for sulfatase activity
MFSKNIISQINPRIIFYSLLLSFITVILSFYFFAKGINIEVSPLKVSSFAEVEIKEGFGLNLDKRLIFFPGKKTILVKANGYYEKESTFIVESSSKTIQVQLDEIPGRIKLNILPVNIDPEIYVDNKLINISNKRELELISGLYKAVIKHPNFLTLEKEIQVEGFGKKQSYEFTLESKTSSLSFKSYPLGAEIFLGEKYIGKTPHTSDIQAGTHQITFRLKDYKDYKIIEKIGINKDRVIDIGELKLLPGKLFIESEPSNSTILVDGTFVGLTPMEAHIEPNTDQEISIINEGFNKYKIIINLSSQEIKNINIDLIPILGKVSIDSNPKSLIYLDGSFLSKTPYNGELSSIKHEVSFVLEGYRIKKVDLIPSSIAENKIIVALTTEEEARFNESPKTYTTTDKHKFILIKPGKITMGAARSEAGQRANEVIRKVQLTKPFFITAHQITNLQFKKFNTRDSNDKLLNSDNKPVVNISWIQAALYCNWLSRKEKYEPVYQINDNELVKINYQSHGYRLPTEAEWSWVSRSNNGKILKFPWGNNMPVKSNSGNYADESSMVLLKKYIPNLDDSFTELAPIGSFKPNDKGLFDLGGNAKEWINDYYSIGYSSKSIEVDPTGPISGSSHVIRGSSWKSSSLTELRLSYRDVLTGSNDDVGFRVVRWLEGKNEK